ncbi:uncharacterized protein ACOB8E_015266 [Sarcophilus harrisii]
MAIGVPLPAPLPTIGAGLARGCPGLCALCGGESRPLGPHAPRAFAPLAQALGRAARSLSSRTHWDGGGESGAPGRGGGAQGEEAVGEGARLGNLPAPHEGAPGPAVLQRAAASPPFGCRGLGRGDRTRSRPAELPPSSPLVTWLRASQRDASRDRTPASAEGNTWVGPRKELRWPQSSPKPGRAPRLGPLGHRHRGRCRAQPSSPEQPGGRSQLGLSRPTVSAAHVCPRARLDARARASSCFPSPSCIPPLGKEVKKGLVILSAGAKSTPPGWGRLISLRKDPRFRLLSETRIRLLLARFLDEWRARRRGTPRLKAGELGPARCLVGGLKRAKWRTWRTKKSLPLHHPSLCFRRIKDKSPLQSKKACRIRERSLRGRLSPPTMVWVTQSQLVSMS